MLTAAPIARHHAPRKDNKADKANTPPAAVVEIENLTLRFFDQVTLAKAVSKLRKEIRLECFADEGSPIFKMRRHRRGRPEGPVLEEPKRGPGRPKERKTGYLEGVVGE